MNKEKSTLYRTKSPILEISEQISRGSNDLLFLKDLCENIMCEGLLDQDLSRYTLEVVAVDSEVMRMINAEHRGKDQITDVLSFPLEDWVSAWTKESEQDLQNENLCDYQTNEARLAGMQPCLGSIVINVELAQSMADRLGHSVQDEITLLFVHGFLHILGYDHEVDNGEQRALEQKIIESLGLGESLIVRVTH